MNEMTNVLKKGDTNYMSLKVVELQIAIPKTFDAGKVAEQLQQQSAVNQVKCTSCFGKTVRKK